MLARTRQTHMILGENRLQSKIRPLIKAIYGRDADQYLCAVHATATKESTTISHETLAEICQAVSIPVVAIGGINADNATPCIKAGCAGVAVVSAIFGASDPALAAGKIKTAVM